MPRWIRMLAMAGAELAAQAHPQTPPWTRVRTALRHPMQYCLSLPQGWCPTRTWPIAVVIPDDRDFQENLAAFVKARGDRPFILVAPFVVTSGGPDFQDAPNFQYEVAVWREVQRAGNFGFDEAGLEAVLAEVRDRYQGEDRAFLTGWENGGHTVWALLFRHPERWAGVAPVTPYWSGRGMDRHAWSQSPERAQVPVKVFFHSPFRSSSDDRVRATSYLQTREAIAAAQARGFGPIGIQMLPQRPRGPQAEAVLAWFESLRKP